MTENETEKAVENLKQCIVKNYKDTPVRFSAVNSADIHTLLTLAEEYLKIKGWPEERKPTNFQGKDYSNPTDEEFNSTRRLCKLAAMKEKSKMSEEINNILAQSPDRISEITIEDYEGVRQKILELINGKEKPCQKNTTE